MKNVKNKKAILISCFALGIVAVGAVFAFSQDSSTLNNSFTIADYKIAGLRNLDLLKFLGGRFGNLF
jgi:hypothetical protein